MVSKLESEFFLF